MNKPILGLVLGGILGIFDGLSALVSTPEVKPLIVGIVIGSTVKGLIAGLLIGWFARKVHSLPLGILFGLAVGAALAFAVAQMQGKYYLEIILPGSLLGIIVGYATQRSRTVTNGGKVAAALLILLLAAPALRAETPVGPVDAQAVFQTLKGLAGTWEAPPLQEGTPPVKVVYAVSANGNVVVETLFQGTPHEMMTLYYLEGGELWGAHYCAAGNRPQFKLDTAASKPGEFVFAFNGGTGFDAAKDSHIHSGTITLKGDGLDNDWTSWAGGKQTGDHRFVLKRVAAGK
ncbi:MAG TPA: hypothetical protein VH988_26095 [Thermoanaerobaculia bacterium]|jgi:hypothetical protein|nr:hypothetical protein [Thermoanaerobaculia bacterium]